MESFKSFKECRRGCCVRDFVVFSFFFYCQVALSINWPAHLGEEKNLTLKKVVAKFVLRNCLVKK